VAGVLPEASPRCRPRDTPNVGPRQRTQDSLVLQTLSIRRLPPPARNMTAYVYAEHDPRYIHLASTRPRSSTIYAPCAPGGIAGMAIGPGGILVANQVVASEWHNREPFLVCYGAQAPAASSTCFAIECAQECAVRFFVGCIWSRRAHLICAACRSSDHNKNVQCRFRKSCCTSVLVPTTCPRAPHPPCAVEHTTQYAAP
jgi:hypothetical protein